MAYLDVRSWPFFFQYTWKSQEVVIRPHQVVNALKYRQQRKFHIIVDKERNRKALASGNVSSLSEADGTDPDDPLVFRKEIVFTRGDLVYFLPDPAWLEEVGDQQTITVEDLRTEEWWIGLVLDCVELRNKNGEADAVLRVAVGSRTYTHLNIRLILLTLYLRCAVVLQS